MYLNLYGPKVQYESGVVGLPLCLLGPDGPDHRGVRQGNRAFLRRGFDLFTFAKGQRKDDIAHEYLANFARDEDQANRRLLSVQRTSADCHIGEDAFAQVSSVARPCALAIPGFRPC